MRFRRLEDEQRYRALHAELQVRIIAALRHDPSTLQAILRNLGKLEHAAFHEGVDQGAVAALVALVLDDGEGDGSDTADMSPADMHHRVYGHRDTPLAEAETECWPQDLPIPWALRAPRAEYAPLTLEEVERAGAPPPPTAASAPDTRVAPRPGRPEAEGGFVDLFGDDDELDLGHSFVDPDLDAEPATLDRIREALVSRSKKGWKPEEWADVVMAVVTDTQIPAYVVDAQLATAQGDAVLKQAGLLNLEASEWGSIPELSDGIDDVAQVVRTIDRSQLGALTADAVVSSEGEAEGDDGELGAEGAAP